MTTAAARRRDLLGLDGLSPDEITGLLDVAEGFAAAARGEAPIEPILRGRIVANLFFEDSTRTRGSFSVAAHRLGAYPLEIAGAGSSVSKGETILDTALTIDAMGVDAIVMRAKPSGAPRMVAQAVSCPVVNAGDGNHEHPTQGLIDALVLRRHLGDLAGKTIALVGDINNSRVARSNLHGLTTLGADVLLVGPPTLVSRDFEQVAGGPGTVTIQHDFTEAIARADAIMMLRVQFERGSDIPPDYRDHYALTVERARTLRDGVIVLHPGPMNRGLEIDSEVADDPDRSVILEQVAAGVAVRMAVLAAVIGKAPRTTGE
jgi:aspartate carbamoyltransferase catalytic subunit